MLPGKIWEDRVIEKYEALRAQREADREMFNRECGYLHNKRSVNNSETLTKKGLTATKGYLNKEVFTLEVQNSKYLITPVGGTIRSFDDRETARNYMSELLAQSMLEAEAEQA